MKFEFDPEKDKINIRKHGISLSMAEYLDWNNAICEVDNRFSYGELRFNCLALLQSVVYYVTYTERANDVHRIISLRQADRSEARRYYEF